MKSTLTREPRMAQLCAQDDQLPGKQPPPFQLKAADPDLRKGDTGSYTSIEDGKPFVGGTKENPLAAISMDDVHQGSMDNCGLFATMAGLAQRYPELVSKLIKDNGDGTYNVTLYEKDYALGPRVPKVFKVANSFPMYDKYNMVYAQKNPKTGQSNELWPMLLEKAVAMLKGGYGKTQMHEQEAMALLTGKGSDRKLTWWHKKTTQMADMQAAIAAGQVVTAATTDFNPASKTFTSLDGKQTLDPLHAYLVVSVDPGKNTVKLYNSRSKFSSILEITLDQFDDAMRSYTIMDK